MRLSISNIAWEASIDEQMYELMQLLSYNNLEIAPTRIFSEDPYSKIADAEYWAQNLISNYEISVSSMQSIWFGRTENIFNSDQERQILIDYTKKAIEFAESINCKNLVFGCPQNRTLPDSIDANIAIPFFKIIGDYAYEHNTIIGLEANPTIYNTNYINSTSSAIELINLVKSPGFKLNLDIGTMIANNEDIKVIENNVDLINHVHISEPYLEKIQSRKLHNKIAALLSKNNYNRCVSIEMKKGCSVLELTEIMKYVKSLFD